MFVLWSPVVEISESRRYDGRSCEQPVETGRRPSAIARWNGVRTIRSLSLRHVRSSARAII